MCDAVAVFVKSQNKRVFHWVFENHDVYKEIS